MEREIKIFLKILGILCLLYLGWVLREFILLFILSFILGTFFRPLVDWLESKKIPRMVGGIIIFGTFFSILILIFTFFLPPLISDIQNFFSRFPSYFSSFLEKIPEIEERFYGIELKTNLEKAIFDGISLLSRRILPLGLGFSKIVFQIFFVIVVAFYLIIEKDYKEIFFLKNLPWFKENEKAYNSLQFFETKLRSWISCYLLAGLYIGIVSFIFLSFLGSKYGVLLGTLVAILEVIPIVGPISAGILIFLILLFEKGLTLSILGAFLYTVFEQIGNYFLIPFLVKKKIKISPLFTIIALAIGSKIGGILGIIAIIPVLASILGTIEETRKMPKSISLDKIQNHLKIK
jgi:predicted PurR-regulated permease PerM